MSKIYSLAKNDILMCEKVLLVFNCHEAWVYQLGVLGYKLDIIVGLKGQYKTMWDEQMRPVPPHSRLITLQQALDSEISYYCIITNNVADLLEVKLRKEPRLLVIHSTIEGRKLEEKSDIEPVEMKNMLHKYLSLVGGHAVAVSKLKGDSWDFAEDIVPFCADPDDYLPYSGQNACGLRICNFIQSRKKILMWDFHEKAFKGLPVKLVGHNPDMQGLSPTEDWDDLKRILASHRFYIHTAEPTLEDGYNMATIEAMAAGMPVLGNRHPGSPIKHGISGFLSDDPIQLSKFAKILLEDRDLAVSMGREAQKTVSEHFSKSVFKEKFSQAMEKARRKHDSRLVPLHG